MQCHSWNLILTVETSPISDILINFKNNLLLLLRVAVGGGGVKVARENLLRG